MSNYYETCKNCNTNIEEDTYYCCYTCEDYHYHENGMANFNEECEDKKFEIFEYPKNQIKQSKNRIFLIRQKINDFSYFYYVEKIKNNIIIITNIYMPGFFKTKIDLINHEIEKKKPLNIVFNENDLLNYLFNCDIKYTIKLYNQSQDTFIKADKFDYKKNKNIYYLSNYGNNIYKIKNALYRGKIKEESNARYTKAAIKK